MSNQSSPTSKRMLSSEAKEYLDKLRLAQFTDPLTIKETQEAVKELSNTTNLHNYPKVERYYADPALNMQKIALFTFIPSKNAKPDDDGIYGFAKIRGCFASEIEAEQYAANIIKNVDSVNKIYHSYVGRPFPVTLDSKYSQKVDEIDLKKKLTDTVSQNIRTQKTDEEQTIREMKNREKELLEDVKKTETEPYEDYITNRVALSQLTFMYLEHEKKMNEVKQSIIKRRSKLDEMNQEYPDFKNTFFDKYKEAREAAGIKEDNQTTNDNFIKYMVEDVDLGF